MPFGRGQIDHSPPGQQVQPAPIGQPVLLDQGRDLVHTADRQLARAGRAGLLSRNRRILSRVPVHYFLLLRLRIDPSLNLVPEISANRLMASVRLMKHEPAERLQPSTDDVTFELALCA